MFLLDMVNIVLGMVVGIKDVIGVYVGLWLLIDIGGVGVQGCIVDVLCDYVVFELLLGVISVVGGKLMEYCYMVEDVLNCVIML